MIDTTRVSLYNINLKVGLSLSRVHVTWWLIGCKRTTTFLRAICETPLPRFTDTESTRDDDHRVRLPRVAIHSRRLLNQLYRRHQTADQLIDARPSDVFAQIFINRNSSGESAHGSRVRFRFVCRCYRTQAMRKICAENIYRPSGEKSLDGRGRGTIPFTGTISTSGTVCHG